MSETNREKFNSVLTAILGIDADAITDDLSPDSVDSWDSLNQINIISALEQEFGVHLAADNLAEYQSVARLSELLASHGIAL
jgi:acyl carrier protein